MKKRVILAFLTLLCFGAFAQNKVDFVDVDYSQQDAFTIRFNIRDKEGNKVFIDPKKDTLRFFENKKEIKSPVLTVLEHGTRKGNISEDITVSILVDRGQDLSASTNAIKEAVKSIVEKIPDSCVFISFFGSGISPSTVITKDNFAGFSENFSRPEKSKALYNALFAKLKEFSGEEAGELKLRNYQQNRDIAKRARTTKNYLIVLTDGNDNPQENAPNIRLNQLNDYADEMQTEIKIFAIRYGQEKEISKAYSIDDILSSICFSRNVNPELRGNFFKASPDSVLNRLDKIARDLEASYMISFAPTENTYAGEGTEYSIQIGKASGQKTFTIGSQEKPIRIASKGESSTQFLITLSLGLLIGLIFFVLIFIIIQMIIPMIRNSMFKSRYYKKYRPATNERIKLCALCRGGIHDGDDIVDCCEHTVHESCWIDAGYQCPEYGQNCKKGKQPYFNINDPFSKENKQSYLSWVLYGLIGGLITWFLYMLLFYAFPNLFASFSNGLVKTFYIGFADKDSVFQNSILSILQNKIQGLLSIGILLGFSLSFVFSLLNEYRKKNFKVCFSVFLRALLGMAFGFVSFLLGCIIMLLFRPSADTTLWWLLSIPAYLLFGTSIGLCLSIKSTISWKHGVLGGAISILIGFIILYTATALLKEYGTMLTFMIYGAGLGFSIATVRSYSEHYFLRIKIENAKEREIAIHKWMNASGGSAQVFVGMSNDCEIQMNWDQSNNVSKKHAKLYYDKSKKVPMLCSLETNIIVNNRNIIKKDGQCPLQNGDEFKIGNTVFVYFEKD